jgi:hypothetical protein
VSQYNTAIPFHRKLENADDTVLMGRVYDLVCKLRDTWHGHMDEEEEVEDDQGFADERLVS